ncbi:hypothetical protein [Nonomuraea dietziae]|uniref:hypothetical protein n=1 Tax=Nonomuraea dietziae TaxID=65515 RepID=UPI0031DEBA50
MPRARHVRPERGIVEAPRVGADLAQPSMHRGERRGAVAAQPRQQRRRVPSHGGRHTVAGVGSPPR